MTIRILGGALVVLALSVMPVRAAEVTPWTLPASAATASEEGEPVLTLTVAGKSVEISLADIEKLPMAQTTLTTNWGVNGTWQGVLLADVLDANGLGKADEVHLLAMDDYAIDIKVQEIRSEKAFLATRFNGKPIEPDDKGPLMLLWPGNAEAVLNGTASVANWIWSIVEISGK